MVVQKFHCHHIPAETAVDSVLVAVPVVLVAVPVVPVADPEVGDAIGLEK